MAECTGKSVTRAIICLRFYEYLALDLVIYLAAPRSGLRRRVPRISHPPTDMLFWWPWAVYDGASSLASSLAGAQRSLAAPRRTHSPSLLFCSTSAHCAATAAAAAYIWCATQLAQLALCRVRHASQGPQEKALLTE